MPLCKNTKISPMPMVRLDGKVAIITGSSTGIGKITAADFYIRGAKVILACRNTTKAQQAVDEIKTSCKDLKNTGELVVAELDLSSFKSVRQFCDGVLKNEHKINLLVNNAGVMGTPKTRTKDGNELHWQTNHLSHFLLTLLLLPKIIESAPARIVNVSSMVHSGGTINFDDLNFEKEPYSALKAYQQSKLANVLFAKELARLLKAANIENVTTYSLHPGVFASEIGRHFGQTYFYGASWLYATFAKWFLKSPEQGAQTTIYCCVNEDLAKESGLYYADCAEKTPSKKAQNMEDAKKLWDVSLKMVGLENYRLNYHSGGED